MARQILKTPLLLFSIFLAACSGEVTFPEGIGNGVVPTTPGQVISGESLSYTGLVDVSPTNQKAFVLQGQCPEVGTKVVISGSFLGQADCLASGWQLLVDLSYLPVGRFAFSLVQAGDAASFELNKNTVLDSAAAAYLFESASNPETDSKGAHDAVATTDVQVVSDSERGNVLEFTAGTAQYELNDGSFLNDEFEFRTVALRFFVNDTSASQLLYDEGGSTNGLAIKIVGDELIVATRAGGSGTQEDVRTSLVGLSGQWNQLIASFAQGELSLDLNGVTVSKTVAYTTIPDHGNDGGIGALHGNSNAFGDSGSQQVFSGRVDDVMIFDQALSANMMAALKGEAFSLQTLNPLDFGLLANFDFADAGDLGNDVTGSHSAVTVTDVTQLIDSELGEVAEFNGTSSVFQLSDGSFLNDEFSARTVVFRFQASDLETRQVLYDEGGTTNGLVVYLDNGYLTASVRSGGSSTQMDLIVDVIDRVDEWIQVAVTFDQGLFKIFVDGAEQVSRTTGFLSVADHSDTGGIGRSHGGGNASGLSGSAVFAGQMQGFRIYERALSTFELQAL